MRKVILCLVALFVVAWLVVGTSAAVDAKMLPAPNIVPTQDPCRDSNGVEICIMFIAFDGRVNPNDPLATITAYCLKDGSIQVYSIINSIGTHLTTATPAQSINALAAANSRKTAQMIVNINGMQLIALPGNILQIADNQTGSGYKYNFAAVACGLPVNAPVIPNNPAATPVKGAPKPPATKVFVPDISASPTEAQAKIDVNIRRAPTITARRIGFVPRGGVMTLIARDAKTAWIKVRYGNLEGWVVAAYTNVQVGAFRALPEAN